MEQRKGETVWSIGCDDLGISLFLGDKFYRFGLRITNESIFMVRRADPLVTFIPGSARVKLLSLTLPYHLVVSPNFSATLVRTFVKVFSPKYFKTYAAHLVR